MDLMGDIHCGKPHFGTLFFIWNTIFLINTCAIFFNHLIEVKIKTLLTGKLIQFYS